MDISETSNRASWRLIPEDPGRLERGWIEFHAVGLYAANEDRVEVRISVGAEAELKLLHQGCLRRVFRNVDTWMPVYPLRPSVASCA